MNWRKRGWFMVLHRSVAQPMPLQYGLLHSPAWISSPLLFYCWKQWRVHMGQICQSWCYVYVLVGVELSRPSQQKDSRMDAWCCTTHSIFMKYLLCWQVDFTKNSRKTVYQMHLQYLFCEGVGCTTFHVIGMNWNSELMELSQTALVCTESLSLEIIPTTMAVTMSWLQPT